MKALSIASLVMVLIIAGCKKESTNTAAKTYLLSKATYNLTHVDGSKSTYVDMYTYDSQNRVIAINSQFAGFNIKYTYNNNNNVSQALYYYPDGSLYYTHKYFYSGNMVVDSSTYDGGGVTNIKTITLNVNGQIQTYNIDNQATSDTCTYDSRGNIINLDLNGNFKEKYTYDDKKNPLSMIGAKNVDMMFIRGIEPLTNVNNLLTSDSNETTYAYTYNSAGFPITANVVVNNPMAPISYTATFEYITN